MPEGVRSSKVVVIGGSEGAIEALLDIIPCLPAETPAAIFVVIHISADADSYLPRVLARCGVLETRHAEDCETLSPGRIYVAPPNHHLTLKDGTINVTRGPRENRHRPAIDPLFRSASRAYETDVIAVVLSGNLDDGSAGLLAVRNRGGIAIVQDPNDARVRQMPQQALDYAGADFVLPASAIGEKLVELIRQRETAVVKPNQDKGSESEVRQHETAFTEGQGDGTPSVFACPECHGVLWEMKEGDLVRYRCRVGHGYTAGTLKHELDDGSERALWAAMRALEEKAALGRRLINTIKNSAQYVKRMKEQVETDTQNAEIIRKMIFDRE